jgi:hypothetical protein
MQQDLPAFFIQNGLGEESMHLLEAWRSAMAAAIFAAAVTSAHAQPAAAIQKYLAAQSKNCSLYSYQENFRGTLPGADRPVVIAAYTLESCGGGNDYMRTVGVFYEADGKVHQFNPPATPIAGPDVDDRDGVTVRGDRIVIRSSAYAPNDPRCCPSLKKTTAYKLVNAAIVPAR